MCCIYIYIYMYVRNRERRLHHSKDPTAPTIITRAESVGSNYHNQSRERRLHHSKDPPEEHLRPCAVYNQMNKYVNK